MECTDGSAIISKFDNNQLSGRGAGMIARAKDDDDPYGTETRGRAGKGWAGNGGQSPPSAYGQTLEAPQPVFNLGGKRRSLQVKSLSQSCIYGWREDEG